MNEDFEKQENQASEENTQGNAEKFTGGQDAGAAQSGSSNEHPGAAQGEAWSVPPQQPGEGYRPPYYAQDYQNPQPPQQNPQPYYSANNGWQQSQPRGRGKHKQSYQWNFNEYQSAAAARPPKQRNKGVRVFIVILSVIVGIAVVSFAGIGIYSTFARGSAAQQSEDTPSLQVPAETIPGITINDKPAEEAVQLPEGKLTSEQIVEKIKPSVVAITTYVNYQNYQAEGMGSGIIFREDGYIVTNAHVVEGALGITVQLSDGTSYEGRVVGSDSKTDLAVVKIDATGLTPAEFGNSDQVKVGEKVLAIGNPQSMDFAGSVTQGIVSGLNRKITAASSNGGTTTHYANLIQTDAAINPGNSGGALVNEYGQVIGINSAKVIASGAEGMGFAIPSNEAKPIVDDLINYGRVTGRVRLGITATEVDEVLARLNHVPTGLFVQSTEEGSDISKQGIVPGDIITKVDDQEITSFQVLTDAIDGKKPGDTVELEVYRPSSRPNAQGKFFTVRVELMEDMGDTDVSDQSAAQQQPSQQPSRDPNDYETFDDFWNEFFG